MRIQILAVGQKMPAWVDTACADFIKRMPPEIRLSIVEVPLGKRGKNPDIQRIIRDEGRKCLTMVPAAHQLVALDVTGRTVTTEQLADMLKQWLQQGADLTLVIGGPDGLSKELLQQAHSSLSLSALTFPHTLIRIMLVEQLYRAWSIISNHPYHRA